jgi:hypothetical protein
MTAIAERVAHLQRPSARDWKQLDELQTISTFD